VQLDELVPERRTGAAAREVGLVDHHSGAVDIGGSGDGDEGSRAHRAGGGDGERDDAPPSAGGVRGSAVLCVAGGGRLHGWAPRHRRIEPRRALMRRASGPAPAETMLLPGGSARVRAYVAPPTTSMEFADR